MRSLNGRSYAWSGVAAVLAVVVVAVASAQAAPALKKNFEASVRVQSAADLDTFLLRLKNDPGSQQTLGSAQFALPTGFTIASGPTSLTSGFTVTAVGTNIVQFGATSSATALKPGGVAEATVTVTKSTLCLQNDGSSSATWTPLKAKQSNDFSGSGNDFNLLSAASDGSFTTDKTPLGSFVFHAIGTNLPPFVPQITIDTAAQVTVDAKDTCGNPDGDYNGRGGTTFGPTPDTPTRLDQATFTGLNWSGATGSGTVKPKFVEAADSLTVTDTVTGITATSLGTTGDTFDAVETICATPGATCPWHNGNRSINASSTVPVPVGTEPPNPSLGFGFRTLDRTCDDVPGLQIKGEAIDMNPRNYANPYTVTLDYAKSLSGTGPVSGFHFCLSDDNAQSFQEILDCAATPVAPCVLSRKRVTNGVLELVLLLKPGDPWGGGFG
jgi:hypothetical protein